MQRLANLIPCLLFAAGTAYLISQDGNAALIFLGGLATFLMGAATIEVKDEK